MEHARKSVSTWGRTTASNLLAGRGLKPEQFLGDHSHRKSLSRVVLLSELLVLDIIVEEPPPQPDFGVGFKMSLTDVSEVFTDALIDAGWEAELVTIPGTSHGLNPDAKAFVADLIFEETSG
jgi:hypothetical protein